ncbi:CKMT2 [Symbiodinium natans]|uniref:CKMT2 protein n=1 Tax=Symbiodinium natans TaxID=878477 RepID=A0A812KA58_9DINO|nr:CKMT2 [Symbiodinium natans]
MACCGSVGKDGQGELADLAEREEDLEQLEYLAEDEAEVAIAPRSEAAGATSLVQEGRQKGRIRNRHLVEPPLPEGIRAYTPGEGYGSNAIPFAGISPKTSKRRNEGNRMKAIEMLKRAKEVADRKNEAF